MENLEEQIKDPNQLDMFAGVLLTPEQEQMELEQLSKAGIFDALPESLAQYFTLQGQQEILVKVIEGYEPAKDILDYFGLYEYLAQREKARTFPETHFVDKEFFDLIKVLKTPIVQIQMADDTDTVMAYTSRFGPLITSTYIFIPNFPFGDDEIRAAVLITKDQLNPTIPLSFLNPETLPLGAFKTAIRPLKKAGPQIGGSESDSEMMF
jgi:hypothetical protein